MSRLRLVYRPEAEQDILEAAEWYETRGAGLAGEFLRAFDAVIASVERNPLQHAEVYPRLRSALFRRFPYSIIYSVSETEIIVLSCAHWRQSPRRWQRRG